ncbi:sensor domain-containing diguanylate cyclase [Shewanella sp. SR43-4]|jgi:diguanylate cyclase (GGDEF)-like protein/PAS domain S-box-containing protein|uniref:diguanylate cyclase n=1 Tax=Shewanella vesiculosa TaxID=518738 RepID=A0ABV0FQ45_9GAMM|nr:MULTISPECIES: sensor domain-containing diguanylate cyclase [Shewanella]NCQ45289.1 sensor domain-containing diguanylate cyclase [Shewanella frigidimarina]MBB1316265.1 sensor domain-containing diguanylate cyclase [Shewanella sp. SR43-4]MBB1321017.1 sensor domain-containing diguanylate cyclase [Shewanella sp. SR43-8]NCO70723.1 sensor domain-containing diguanylate cyclase [Shewanella vesiculosa]NCP36840.1 sensor domain-containing diguanylate cyclase [Shewanella vesiculosa]|tara:strand:+ start:1627 stop:2583 length:957 start_codon:yes stop_codon:yes gene_type:complete
MSNDQSAMNELHWLIDMVQTIEVGLVVLDRDYNIQLWNGFMENHSGVSPNSIKGKNLFEQFPDLQADWLKKKMESVFVLKNRTFISWEQRPYVFKFKNYRPVTGRADFMYQNITLLPLASLTGQITHISIIVYDVTDIAVNKLQLKSANEQLEQLSQTDGLTQLHNRRHWQDCMEKEFDRYSRYGDAASLVMIDIDNFKLINDKYGHPAGDKVIQHIAYLLKQALRETDCAGRYGGEEFGVVLSKTTAEDALNFTERLRKRIEESEIAFENRLIKVTISIGINDLDSEIDNSSTWLSGADKALYLAKQQGRNQSIINK